MKELIEALNHTSPARTITYCIVGLLALTIVSITISEIVNDIFKKRKQD